ncbi:META domain-containing protein [Pseudomonas sp. ZM23]|uniref:META domain-containing protein n=1 Tax=Pseudomonas triclosanedens TaxID=2961893 RepID=A0ABY6ZTY8_9PSED|nr:META domain-containing protein [Pseudomonas triclosanedens]MCP8463592.1 META domain-containing protein [Pseudomonas triclosanedens]MCP8469349.1 META domain-containing protein [Pseudomonas triclosanedens]MCP8474393.1 META domain-containing protein [Pseudomonas triclosanedens]WAI48223.1 META domain-containing protein [Pseudomonas triclosanedens]
MKALIAGACVALALAGCASKPVPEAEQTYRVEWIGERPLIDYSHITLTLDGNGRAYGSAGCNHWFASYTLDGDTLTFGPAGSTRKMCADALMEQEGRFLKMLGEIQRWDLTDEGELRLWPVSGRAMRMWPEG